MKKKLSICAIIACVLLSISAPAFAGDYKNGNFWITCNLSCTSSKVEASTKGAPRGYYNKVNAFAYNSKGSCLGNSSSLGSSKATATVKKSKIQSAKSSHFVSDSSGNSTEPLYKQVVLYK